ncbi:MAG: hypothetical protein ACFFBH_08500 [Promethearchaeota archaeon]
MDIAKFNKELSYRVAKATGLENNNKVKEAIDEWVAISEMAIKTSKTPNIEFSYKSMLIDKTKQIIEHIKSLKLSLITENKITKIEESELKEENDVKSGEVKESLISEEKIEGNEINAQKPIKIVEKSQFKNIPKGFKEIEATKDFEIITPHDKDYIKKIISQDQIDINKKEESQNKIICFACGQELPSSTNICPKCGTHLKNS